MAAAAGLPLLIAGVRAAAPKPRFFSWQGEVLGAASELTLWHWDEALARRAILKVRHEIERYEGIFSLYRDSDVTRLNRDGFVAKPSPELIEVIDASQRLGTSEHWARSTSRAATLAHLRGAFLVAQPRRVGHSCASA
jgi:thiamine biosynthesis lipoprotein